MPAVIFKAKDYYGVMAEECKLTVMGKFLRTRPKIEVIRDVFMEKKNSLKGTVKIGAYARRTVFIDFSDEQECKNFYFRRALEINGFQMWLKMWTPDFRPDHDSPIVPVWVLLPELPFHCHSWHYVE